MLQNTSPLATVLVEARKDRVPAEILDAMADTCCDLGYRVVRWRGPLSGRLPYRRWLPPCNVAILYNGAHRSYRPALARLHARGAATLLVELGWHPQRGSYQVDPQGVNANASWAAEPLHFEKQTRLPVRNSGDLLLLLQLNNDTQITERSPWFADMESLIAFVCSHSQLSVRVRPHPLDRNNAKLQQCVQSSGGAWDERSTLNASLADAKAVACVNSSAGVTALSQHLPVLCYGEAIYRHIGAVFCLDNQPAKTVEATHDIAGGSSGLWREACDAMVSRITHHQWTVNDVSERLPSMLTAALTRQSAATMSITSSDRVERTICWFADLPSRLLYRHRLRPNRMVG